MEKIIIVFSDSHGSSFNMSETMKKYPNAECVIHLGDGADDTSYLALPPTTGLLCVKGNCDLFSREPAYNRVNLCGLDIIMCHGDAFGVKRGLDGYRAHAAAEGCDIALFGHTHTPLVERTDNGSRGLYLVNPGSISRPVTEKPSYAVIRVDGERFTVKINTV